MQKGKCAVEGCEGNIRSSAGYCYGHGYCSLHYQRWRRHGDPCAGRAEHGEALRFILDVALPYQGNDCLIWPFGKYADGYGCIRVSGSAMRAHRQVCILKYGPAPSSKYDAAHSCGKGSSGCVNPNHLRWATHSENQSDRVAHGTSNRGQRCASAKLTEADVRHIRKLAETSSEIARRFNVAASTIRHIKSKQSWAWLD